MTSAAPLSRDELLELLEDLSQTLARSGENASPSVKRQRYSASERPQGKRTPPQGATITSGSRS